MRIVSVIARYLMALIFVVFGSNHLFNFLPQPPPPPGAAGQFIHILISTGYLYVVGVCEVVPGILLLVNRFVALALLILGPVIVNIFLTGILFEKPALISGIVLIFLWILTAWRVRSVLFPALRPRVAG
jgi:putative oxidoreductase